MEMFSGMATAQSRLGHGSPGCSFQRFHLQVTVDVGILC